MRKDLRLKTTCRGLKAIGYLGYYAYDTLAYTLLYDKCLLFQYVFWLPTPWRFLLRYGKSQCEWTQTLRKLPPLWTEAKITSVLLNFVGLRNFLCKYPIDFITYNMVSKLREYSVIEWTYCDSRTGISMRSTVTSFNCYEYTWFAEEIPRSLNLRKLFRAIAYTVNLNIYLYLFDISFFR